MSSYLVEGISSIGAIDRWVIKITKSHLILEDPWNILESLKEMFDGEFFVATSTQYDMFLNQGSWIFLMNYESLVLIQPE